MAVGNREMRILGINKGTTLTGKNLRFGGAAIYDNGGIQALGEERPTGRKHAGGYEASLAALLAPKGLRADTDFDHIAVSTCCESVSAALRGHPLEGHERLVAIPPHLSHASLAYFGSGFPSALVVVADGGGNTLQSSDSATPKWWADPREQCSYYLGVDGRLELIGRDFTEPYAVGLGEMYRAFTYFLGWHSSTHASKTMALAGHGRRGAFGIELFDFDGARIVSPLANDPHDPIGMVGELGRQLGVDFGEPRSPKQAILRIHRDVAAFVQEGIENALVHKLSILRKQYGVQRLCLAGGLANNVVLNGRLLELFPDGTYVPSAPGDEGQCLGNVYALLAKLGV